MNIRPDRKMSPEIHYTKRCTSDKVHIYQSVPGTILNLLDDNLKLKLNNFLLAKLYYNRKELHI